MIVCLCYGVSDSEIRSLRDAGHATLGAIGRESGAGTCCGCCRASIKDILAEPRAGAEPRVVAEPTLSVDEALPRLAPAA